MIGRIDLGRLKRYRGHNALELLTRAIDLTLVNDDVSGLNESTFYEVISSV